MRASVCACVWFERGLGVRGVRVCVCVCVCMVFEWLARGVSVCARGLSQNGVNPCQMLGEHMGLNPCQMLGEHKGLPLSDPRRPQGFNPCVV